jgi:phosphoglycerate dehydrogenase-like enzyme
MIGREHFETMKPYSSFINTARGAVIRETEMIEVLRTRPDIHAVLDVTHPEPPAPDSPLYILENVTLTPHIAGSKGNECRRMGRYMVDELERYLKDEKLKWEITRQMAAKLA